MSKQVINTLDQSNNIYSRIFKETFNQISKQLSIKNFQKKIKNFQIKTFMKHSIKTFKQLLIEKLSKENKKLSKIQNLNNFSWTS